MGPGVRGQFHAGTADFITGCDVCHAPLHEQRAPGALRDEAVTCAACHLRSYEKHGPLKKGVTEPEPGRGLRATGVPRFGRSDFCLPCHNLPLTVAVAGRPLLDTWREWAASSYLVDQVQCQDCHQPGADHSFRGAHDLEMARSAVRLDIDRVAIEEGHVVVDVSVHNIGAGHHFPTTATPKAILCVRQLSGPEPLLKTAREWSVAREVSLVDGRWKEHADTRIPAGASIARRYRVRRVAGADAVQISLRLLPDAFYTGFFEKRVAATPPPAARGDYQTALAESRTVLWLHVQRRPL
jgi:hypothetical protein